MKNMNLPNLYESQVRGWNSSGKHIGEWGATTALIAPKSTGGLMLNPTWEIEKGWSKESSHGEARAENNNKTKR